MIPVAAGVRIWIATGHTDMRKGMQGLALLVQEGHGRDPFAGDVFVFRGRGGSLIKALASGEDRGRVARVPSSCLTVSDVGLAPIPGQELI